MISLNNKLTTTEKNADALKRAFDNEDFERKSDIDNKIIDQIAGCKFDINGSKGDGPAIGCPAD